GETAAETRMEESTLPRIRAEMGALTQAATREVLSQGAPPERIELRERAHLRYEGTDTALITPFGGIADMRRDFEAAYKRRFSFLMPSREIIIEAISVEAIGKADTFAETPPHKEAKEARPPAAAAPYAQMGRTGAAPVFLREALALGQRIDGPAIIAERNATTVVEPGWRAEVTPLDHLLLRRVVARESMTAIGAAVDPVMLEVFNNLFM